MISAIVNAVAVIVGAVLGLFLKRGIPERVSKAVMTAMGLCVVYIGIDGALSGDNAIVLVVSLAIGTLVGTFIDLDAKLTALGVFIERKMKMSDGKTSIAEGFVSGSLLFCVGAMAIVGSLESGLNGNHEIIFTKSIIDMISACMLATTLGIGVAFSAVCVFVYQGALVLCSGLLSTALTDAALVAEISCAGSVIIIGLGLNMLGITKIKVANMLPAVIFVPLVYYLVSLIPM